MIDEQEIARFRDTLDCGSEACMWEERADGSAWCVVCGSGFLPSARELLAKLEARLP